METVENQQDISVTNKTYIYIYIERERDTYRYVYVMLPLGPFLVLVSCVRVVYVFIIMYVMLVYAIYHVYGYIIMYTCVRARGSFSCVYMYRVCSLLRARLIMAFTIIVCCSCVVFYSLCLSGLGPAGPS